MLAEPMIDTELKPCRKCGSSDLAMWDGRGTQAELSCNECGQSEGVQVCDLFLTGVAAELDAQFRYPIRFINLAKDELIAQWNIRTPDPLLAEAMEALEWICGYVSGYCVIVHPKENTQGARPDIAIMDKCKDILAKYGERK